MLRQQINEDMIKAMKAQDATTLETVRYVWSEIKKAEIDLKHEMTDEEVIELLRREVKRRNDAITLMKGGRKTEAVTHEESQLIIINKYLPRLMSKEEVEKAVEEVIEGGQSEFGLVMREVMAKVKGKADGKMVSEVVREMLN